MKYKFRGQILNTYEWVYGSLYGDKAIIQDGEGYVVNPETIGLRSGCRDSAGVPIYENDILLDMRTNRYYTVTFDGTNFWCNREPANMPYILLCDLDMYNVKVVGNSYMMEE